jgi:hypothetical protein
VRKASSAFLYIGGVSQANIDCLRHLLTLLSIAVGGGWDPWPVFVKGARWNSRKLKIVSCYIAGGQRDQNNVRADLKAMVSLQKLPGTVCYGHTHGVATSTTGSWRKMYITQPPLRVMVESSPGNSLGRHNQALPLGKLFPWKQRAITGQDDGNDDSDVSENDVPLNDED